MIGCGFIWYKYRGYLKIRLWVRCILLLIGVLLIVGAYYYKQDSANGRLLIWRITADMIPYRVTPRYKVAMLYYEMGDMLRFRLMGDYIMKMEIKVESTKALEMIAEIKHLYMLLSQPCSSNITKK